VTNAQDEHPKNIVCAKIQALDGRPNNVDCAEVRHGTDVPKKIMSIIISDFGVSF
jgi:hypothetical protein